LKEKKKIISRIIFIVHAKKVHNVAGLGDGRKLYILPPERQPNKVTKDEIMNKKVNKGISARTIAETCTTAHC